MSPPNIAAIRTEYRKSSLDESQVLPNPMDQFSVWFDQALQAGITEPSAMILSTVSNSSEPSSRVVLLKGIDNGFLFFTNYESRKGTDLATNPKVALLFFWSELERQVRIQGLVEKLTENESAEYFASRPRESQIGAWSSRQSSVVNSRDELDDVFRKQHEEFAGGDVPKPPFWGGFRVLPHLIEFWQGRSSRMHDRLQYRISADSTWMIERLSP